MPASTVNSVGESSVFIQVYGPHNVIPALISWEERFISEGGTLQLMCQIAESGRNAPELPEHLFFHLCKDGVGRIAQPVGNNTHTIFLIENITREDYGKYSCVLAEEQMAMKVRGEGVNSINIQDYVDVIHPARIFGTVDYGVIGEDVGLKCSIMDGVHTDTFRHPYVLYMHLCKDFTKISTKPLNQTNNAIFTIRNITATSSGSFSCVYSNVSYEQACLRGGLNTMFLKVYAYCKTDHFDITSTPTTLDQELIESVARVTQSPRVVWPARIYARKVSVVEGEELIMKCSLDGVSVTGGTPERSSMHMYLLKDGRWVSLKPFKKNADLLFSISNVTVRDSGNYSCVYSKDKHAPQEGIRPGHNVIPILVLTKNSKGVDTAVEHSADGCG
ncbi:hypothetical protein ACEWY4_026914 [Coilia grayii]|uniref:Ig-like domain-containing protein n=1 Tax=Coilia grayii TaxID=363190 RepID=A0ABD1IT56_9TELE